MVITSVLLKALIYVPVGVAQNVGYLLVLFVAAVKVSLPTNGGASSSSASIAGRTAATAAHGRAIVTGKEQEQADKDCNGSVPPRLLNGTALSCGTMHS